MNSPLEVRVHAPGSVGNVGPGLDILGLALEGAGDEVRLRRDAGDDITVVDPGDPALPTDPRRHAAAIAAAAVFRRAGVPGGAQLWLRKGLPLSGGQGGSAASAVAGAVAADRLAGAALPATVLLECALDAEMVISGRHADNLAPSLFGGLTLVRSLDPVDVIALPLPAGMHVVVIRPDQQLLTRDARAVLPAVVAREIALHQAAQVAAMVAGACLGDLRLFGRAIDDRIAEPARAGLLPGFLRAKEAALGAGAFGCSISGAGPTAFAIVPDARSGGAVLEAMTAAYAAAGVRASGRVATPDLRGAREVASA